LEDDLPGSGLRGVGEHQPPELFRGGMGSAGRLNARDSTDVSTTITSRAAAFLQPCHFDRELAMARQVP
jgi:hypothetical protein